MTVQHRLNFLSAIDISWTLSSFVSPSDHIIIIPVHYSTFQNWYAQAHRSYLPATANSHRAYLPIYLNFINTRASNSDTFVIGGAADAAALYLRTELRYRDHKDGIRTLVKNRYETVSVIF